MKKNIKNLYLVAMIIGALFMIGCGNKESEPITSETVEISTEIMESTQFSGKLQVGNTIIDVPCTLSTLIDCEVILTDTTLNAGYLLESGATANVPVILGTMSFVVVVENKDDTTQRLCDCEVIQIQNVTSNMITFPGGIVAGNSIFEQVSEIWGDSQGSEVDTNQNLLIDYFYREGVPAKDLYAWNAGGTETTNADEIIDVNGTSYAVSYNRVTGIISSVTATFHEKSGIDEYESITYHESGVDITFDILKDAYDLEDDPVLYCIETIDDVDYIIGVGIVNSSFDESGMLLEPDEDTEKETTETQNTTTPVIENLDEQASLMDDDEEQITSETTENDTSSIIPNKLGRDFLQYGNYDFSEDYTIINSSDSWQTFFGESSSDSIYFAISAEMQKKAACSFVFYMHPVNREDIISESALDYMHGMIEKTRESINFN